MPPKKAVEGPKEAEECILRFGKYNNIIQWRDALEVSVCALYGLSGQFLITNERYVPPMPREQDYVQVNPPLEEGEVTLPSSDRCIDPKVERQRLRRKAKKDRQTTRTREEHILANVGEDVNRVSKQSNTGSRVQECTREPGLGATMGIHKKHTSYTHIRCGCTHG